MSLQQSLALSVVLASKSVVVPRGAVGLDDQATFRPRKSGTTIRHASSIAEPGR
jgi:hypothetical protein